MIALMMLASIVIYILVLILSLWIVSRFTEEKKVKFAVFVIWFLIPTWDVIIGYPIYKFLCATQAGIEIYKTVDNVEGFYVGEQQKQYEPIKPYEGYKYIDYKEINFSRPSGKLYGNYWTGKYYRSYWIDSNTSKECIKPKYPDSPYDEYTKAFNSGKCIVKKEIAEAAVSELWLEKRKVERYTFFYLNIYRVDFTIENRKNHEKYFTVRDYFVDKSWITGALNFVSGNKSKNNCFENSIYSSSSGFAIYDQFVLETLKTKKEEK